MVSGEDGSVYYKRTMEGEESRTMVEDVENPENRDGCVTSEGPMNEMNFAMSTVPED